MDVSDGRPKRWRAAAPVPERDQGQDATGRRVIAGRLICLIYRPKEPPLRICWVVLTSGRALLTRIWSRDTPKRPML